MTTRSAPAPSHSLGFYLGAIVALLLLAIMATVSSTHMAHKYGDHYLLGKPLWLAPWSEKVYAPQDGLMWMLRYDQHVANVTELMKGVPFFSHPVGEPPGVIAAWQSYRITSAIELGVAFAVLIGFTWRFGRRGTSDLHGRQRWATVSDIRKSKLAGNTTGTVLASTTRGAPLIYDGVGNVIVFGPPNSGKTLSTAIATLARTWLGSAIVLDPATDIYESDATKNGIRILRFDARSPKSTRINPLAGIKPKQIAELRTVLAVYTMPASMKAMDADSRYFEEGALELLIAFSSLAIERGTPTLGDVARLVTDTAITSEKELVEMLLASSVLYVQQTGARFAAMESKQRSPIVATMHQHLALFRIEEIDRATSASDIDAAELRRMPAHLYLTMNQRDQQSLSGLYAMILDRLLDDLSRALPRPGDLEVLAMIDEFHLVASASLAIKLATLRKFAVRIILLTQTYAQLLAKCGNDETLSGVCDVRVYYPTLDVATQELASKTLGSETRWQETYSSKTQEGSSSSGSSKSEVGRQLLLPAELGEMQTGHVIVHMRGVAPIKGRRTNLKRLP